MLHGNFIVRFYSQLLSLFCKHLLLPISLPCGAVLSLPHLTSNQHLMQRCRPSTNYHTLLELLIYFVQTVVYSETGIQAYMCCTHTHARTMLLESDIRCMYQINFICSYVCDKNDFYYETQCCQTSNTALIQPSFSGLLVTCAYFPVDREGT